MAKYDGPIVITGMGTISPFGAGVEALWSALVHGKRQAIKLEKPEQAEQPMWGLKIGDWQPANLLGRRGLQYMRPGTQFLLGASLLALRDAGLEHEATNPDELGVVVGTNMTGLQSITDFDYTAITKGPHDNSPMETPNTLSNAAASRMAIRIKARALNTTIASGQCAGLDALGYATKAVRAGRARQIVVGAVEELSPAVLWICHNLCPQSCSQPEDAGLPFDETSGGCLPSEGAAVVVLERKAEALERGARPLAELTGWSSAFAPVQTAEKRANALIRAARQALEDAGKSVEDIDVVVSGANGVKALDQTEALALHELLAGNQRARVTAIKGTLGDTYGASGLFQALAAVCMLNHSMIPSTQVRKSQPLPLPVQGLSPETHTWPESGQGTILLLAQDAFGSTSAVVLQGCQR